MAPRERSAVLQRFSWHTFVVCLYFLFQFSTCWFARRIHLQGNGGSRRSRLSFAKRFEVTPERRTKKQHKYETFRKKKHRLLFSLIRVFEAKRRVLCYNVLCKKKHSRNASNILMFSDFAGKKHFTTRALTVNQRVDMCSFCIQFIP